MKKVNYLKLVIALIVTATFSIYKVQAQSTYASGAQTNGCANLAGTTGTNFGCGAGNVNTGSYNAFFGDHAGFKNTSGAGNVFSGYETGYWNVSGVSNTFYGLEAGESNTDSYNTFIGANAGSANTSGDENTFLGYTAGFNNNTGIYNTFLGTLSAHENTTGSSNVCLGLNAGYYNQTGSSNVILGNHAGNGSSGNSYDDNCFIGFKAGFSNTTGTANVFLGYEAGYANTSGGGLNNTFGNTFIGYDAANGCTTSFDNVCVGFGAGVTITDNLSSENTCIGEGADIGANTYSNATAIGYGAVAGNTDWVRIGNSSVTQIWCQPGIWNNSDRRIKNNIKENVPGLAFINLLKPVTYNYDIHKENSMLGYHKITTINPAIKDSLGNIINPASSVTTIDTTFWNGKYDIEKINYTGLIAQQVDSATQKLGYDFSGIYRPKNSNDIYGLNYAQFVVPLIKAVQELSKTVDSLKATMQTTGAVQRTRNNSNSTDPDNATSINNIELANNAVLYQNAPNPFGSGTTIKYFVPDNADAQVVFYDEFGTQLKTFKIAENGTGQLNIDASNLSTGIYSYSLIVNRKVVDTKKMIKQ